MDCDPQALTDAARCFRCLPRGLIGSVKLYLLCQWANAGGAPPCDPPAVPLNLLAVAGDHQVTLSWTNSAGATGYNIKRSMVAGGPYTTLAVAPGSPVTDVSTLNGVTYYYVISALNACGESANSGEVEVIVCDPPPAISFAGWNIGPGTAWPIIHCAASPFIDGGLPLIQQFTVSWGTTSPSGPFPNSQTTVTGLAPGASGNFATNLGMMASDTLYYFKVVATSEEGCVGAPVYAQQTSGHVEPVVAVAWAPTTEVATWDDMNGPGQTGDLPTFLVTADMASVTRMAFNVLGDITSITGLASLPSLNKLECNNNALTSLSLTGCQALNYLDCSYNSLTTLDVSTNTALAYLYCSNNALTTLDVSTCTALTTLDCSTNSLTTLDVTGCTSLTFLSASFNSLSTLDVSSCTSLDILGCDNNLLTTLNVTGCTALSALNCSTNALTALNVSTCTALNTLFCNANLLTTLNLTGCVVLDSLDCNDNLLTALNVSTCISLTYMDCSSNVLTSLNVTGCTILSSLDCSSNQLIALDVSTCTVLVILDCHKNTIASLNIGSSTGYTTVTASDNLLPDAPNGVNDVLLELVGACLSNTGTVDLSGTGNATPTGTGILAKTALLGSGTWMVATN